MSENKELKKCMEKIECALPDMFRFVLDPQIPADNNPAEKQPLEIAVHRKVRGCIRSKKMMNWMGARCSRVWAPGKGIGKDYVKELARYT